MSKREASDPIRNMRLLSGYMPTISDPLPRFNTLIISLSSTVSYLPMKLTKFTPELSYYLPTKLRKF